MGRKFHLFLLYHPYIIYKLLLHLLFLRQPPAPAALPTAPLTALSYEIKKGSTEEPFLGEKDAKHE